MNALNALDIRKIPLYYISFDRVDELESQLRQYGFENVNHFPAVDGRKMDLLELRRDGIISARTFNDLLSKQRCDSAALASVSGVGCSLSHLALLQKCVDDDLEYIVVVEDDAVMKRDLTNEIAATIGEMMATPNTVVLGNTGAIRKVRGKPTFFYGAHFYIASNGACKQLIEDFLPIDIQIDHYLAHMDTIGKINVEQVPLADQKLHLSSTQNLCFLCKFPRGPAFWIGFLIVLVAMVIALAASMWKLSRVEV
jgi:hypothetical protein